MPSKNSFLKNKKPLLLIGFVSIFSAGLFQNCSREGFEVVGNGSSVSNSSSIVQKKSVILAWDSNTQADLAGYKIYYGNSSSSYTKYVDVGMPPVVNGSVSYQIENLEPNNTYYFSVVAYDSQKNESSKSNEVTKLVLDN